LSVELVETDPQRPITAMLADKIEMSNEKI
jgi:hypothetical protein